VIRMAFPPEWHTLGREAELAAEQLAIGVTALGHANHTQKGLYHQAFFALSIGFERLANRELRKGFGESPVRAQRAHPIKLTGLLGPDCASHAIPPR
jgi:hypothetical protein